MSLYLCAHHDDGPAGVLITAATEAALRGPWVLGGEHPATHIYLVWEDDRSGIKWRFEGMPPTARISAHHAWRMTLPLAVWRVRLDAAQDWAAIAAIRQLDGTPYDWGEIAASAAAAAGAMLRALPFAYRLRALGRADPLHGAAVCTRIGLKVLSAAGVYADLPTLLPEQLAQWARERQTSGLVDRIL